MMVTRKFDEYDDRLFLIIVLMKKYEINLHMMVLSYGTKIKQVVIYGMMRNFLLLIFILVLNSIPMLLLYLFVTTF